jgi:Lipoprotein LpqB beta-propeller domain/Sporulation and spore germination
VLSMLTALLVAALSATGCVSMPTGGPVQSYPVTQGADTQNQPYVQVVPQPPGANWSPTQIVQGFLTASASYGNDPQVVKEYLTPTLAKTWDPGWSAFVYSSGPNVTGLDYQPSGAKDPETATVRITGTRQAALEGHGTYSVASSSSSSSSSSHESLGPQPKFLLKKVDGQWRISAAPFQLLLTTDSFKYDYQLANLYFFDPAEKYLVPDPVYVPVQAKPGSVMNGLVSDLITPPADWLSAGGATKTAFPKGTKISDVTLDGVTAIVNLTGTGIAKASSAVMEQVSAQLLNTLSGAAQIGSTGQGVQSVEVDRNGKPWLSPNAQGSPVQETARWTPPSGASSEFYYVDSAGDLTAQTDTDGKPVSLGRIGTGYTQIAVSPDDRYLAALRGSTLYTGVVGGALTKRSGSYTSMSWDASDDLWASQGDEIVEFRTGPNKRQPLGQMVAVSVVNAYGSVIGIPNGQYTALQVAPDGVRVAMVIGDNELTFGAISGQQGASPQIELSLVQQSPVNANTFTGLTWYGSDDVITLATPGPAVTEYPVSGGAPTSIPSYPGMTTITASSGRPLIASVADGHMVADPSLSGSWMTLLGSGSPPAYPG